MAKVQESPADVPGSEAVPPASPSEQYVVTTDNPEFTGRIMGVQITQGKGLLNRQSIDTRLNRTFEQVLVELKQMPGYHVRPA